MTLLPETLALNCNVGVILIVLLVAMPDTGWVIVFAANHGKEGLAYAPPPKQSKETDEPAGAVPVM